MIEPTLEGPDDITLRSIPVSVDSDPRRYNVGLNGLTAQMAPFIPGEFIVVGAREGHGKTAWAECFALRNSVDYQVMFVTLEMNREEIRDRLLAKLMRTGLDQMRFARRDQSEDYTFAETVLLSRNLYVWKPPTKKDRTVEGIIDRAMGVDADILVIDYGREIQGWKPGDAAAEVVDRLGQFVRWSRMTTMLLSQLNRESVAKRPHNGNLQDTGRLEQKADRVILLHRPYLGIPRKDRIVEIFVTKNRQGSCFRWHAHWEPSSMNYFDMSDEESERAECCQRRKSTREL